jgi:hypothetical protein
MGRPAKEKEGYHSTNVLILEAHWVKLQEVCKEMPENSMNRITPSDLVRRAVRLYLESVGKLAKA